MIAVLAWVGVVLTLMLAFCVAMAALAVVAWIADWIFTVVLDLLP